MSRQLYAAAVLCALAPTGAGAAALGPNKGSDACLDCKTETCTLLPPDGSSFPCYEGALEAANKCYNTDPLLSEDTVSTHTLHAYAYVCHDRQKCTMVSIVHPTNTSY
jgi:hypothetical protein